MREGLVAFGEWQTWFRTVGEVGERAPLVCLHGGPGSSHHYFARLEPLAERGRAVVLYDQVGCGGSSRPAAEDLNVETFVAELANLRAELGLEHVTVLGTSWGGMLAIEYALTKPDGLQGLVLNSTLASARTWASEAARLRDRLPQPHAEALRTAALDDPGYAEAERIFNSRHVCRVQDAVEVRRWEEARNPEVYRAMWGPNEWTITGKLAGWDVRDRLHEIDVPVLLTAGRHDLCTDLVLQELRQGFPDAPVTVFGNSSHTPYLEEPEVFVERIGDFLDETDPV